MILKLSLNFFILVIICLITRLIIKSNSNTVKKILEILLLLLVIWIICFSTDYILVQNQKLPIFCYKLFGIFSYQDGGTIEYIGFGYKVIDFHKIVYGQSGWENTFKFEEKYICPWFTSYNNAFDYLEQKHLLEN